MSRKSNFPGTLEGRGRHWVLSNIKCLQSSREVRKGEGQRPVSRGLVMGEKGVNSAPNPVRVHIWLLRKVN